MTFTVEWTLKKQLSIYLSSLGGVYVPCTYLMPGGVIVGDSGLCCYGPAFNVAFERHVLCVFWGQSPKASR